MKYTFEVTTHENENTIKLDVSYGSLSNNVTRTVTFVGGEDHDDPALDELLTNCIDNMRLTVKEREEAIYNAGVFKWYIQQYGVNANKVKQQMIVENGDPSVITQELS